jgi:hypothetical protein
MILFSSSGQSVRTARVLKLVRLWRLLRLLRTARFFRALHGFVAENAMQNRALPKLGTHSEVLKVMDTSGDGYFHFDELESSMKRHHILAQDGVLRSIFDDIIVMVQSGGQAGEKSVLGQNIVSNLQVRSHQFIIPLLCFMLPALCEGVLALLGLILVVGYHVLGVYLFVCSRHVHKHAPFMISHSQDSNQTSLQTTSPKPQNTASSGTKLSSDLFTSLTHLSPNQCRT